MSFDAETLYRLLPEHVRDRDGRGPLWGLVQILAEQAEVVEESLHQAYDDLFVETCAEWVVPYIGDLVSARALHAQVPGLSTARAEVARTLSYRRRKGTATMLEDLARSVTGWDAVGIEMFERVATTQHLVHLRAHQRRPDLRERSALIDLGTPFDRTPRSADVRGVDRASARYQDPGLHNLPNVALVLYRLRAFSRTQSRAALIGPRRFTFSPLGAPVQLFSLPVRERDVADAAGAVHVPAPITHRMLTRSLADYYPRSFTLFAGGAQVAIERIVVADLADSVDGGGQPTWSNGQATKYAVDPLRGRIVTPLNEPAPAALTVTYHYGFSQALGGGEYTRPQSAHAGNVVRIDTHAANAQAAFDTALATGTGVIELRNSGTLNLPATLVLGAGTLVLGAAPDSAPVLRTPALVTVRGTRSQLVLEGLWITGGALETDAGVEALVLRDCTLVPGLARDQAGAPVNPTAASVRFAGPGGELRLERCVTGPLIAASETRISLSSCLLDAGTEARVALAGPGATAPAGELELEACTIVGRVWVRRIDHARNSIVLASAPAPTDFSLRAEVRQEGALCHCFVPRGAATPPRSRCVVEDDTPALRPRFTSLSFGAPGYGQLRVDAPDAIRRGADDDAELGVFHDLFSPQREINLRTRLDEYLRFGLSAAIRYAT